MVGLGLSIAAHDGGYPIREWLAWPLLTLWGWCALLHGACLAFGHLVLCRGLKVRDRPLPETLVVGAAVGLVAFTLMMYGAGALGLFRSWVALVLPVGMLLAGAPSLWQDGMARRARSPGAAPSGTGPFTGTVKRVALGIGLACIALLYLQSMTPEALNYDARWYHLTISQDYAREGRIVPFLADYNKAFPHLASIVQTWVWLIPGLDQPMRWMLALHNEFCLVLWALAGVAVAAAWLAERTHIPGAWVAFFLFPSIFTYDSNLGGSADHFVGFFAIPIFLATARAILDLSPRHCAVLAIVTAGAVLTKYQAIYFIVPIGLLVGGRWLERLLRTRLAGRSLPGLWRGPLVLVALGVLVSAPHFLKNWMFYRNPLYPFMSDVFPGSRPAQPDSAILISNLLTGDSTIPRGPFLPKLWDAILLTFGFWFRKAAPAMGATFVLLLPAIFFVRGKRRLWLGIFFSVVALVVWAFTYPVDRYLQCLLPVIAAVTAALLVRIWELGLAARAALVSLVGFQILLIGDVPFLGGQSRMNDAINLITSGGTRRFKTRFAHYLAAARAVEKRLPADAVLLFHNTRLSLGFDRPVLQDLPGFQGLIDYRAVQTPRELHELYRSFGVTHIVSEPGQWPCLSKQEEVLFAAFSNRFATGGFREGEYRITEIPPEPPPQEPPYQVLLLGQSGYADGVYPVRALGIYEPLPDALKHWPGPARPTTAESAAQPEIIGQVQAAVIATGVHVSSSLSSVLQREFASVVSYGDRFTVWVRRIATAD